MQYLLLIYASEDRQKNATPKDRETMFMEYRDLTQSIIKSGNMRAGDALQPTSTATTVRVREGKTLSTDGPFAETKEQLGGYYLVEARISTRRRRSPPAFPGRAPAASRCAR